eukprot:2671022-Alexandrium_andersonii.AAC.1
MSASLVGSEMCIRDSSSTAARGSRCDCVREWLGRPPCRFREPGGPRLVGRRVGGENGEAIPW